MRILFLTQVLPFPLDAGPKVRAYYTLRHLCQQHEVTLLSFVRPGDPAWAVDHLRSICERVQTVPMRRARRDEVWHLGRSLLSATPFLIARDHMPRMLRTVDDLMHAAAGGFDVVHADQLWMAPYALRARQSATGGRGPRLVLDQHNAVFQVPRRLAAHARDPLRRALLRLEASKLARYELQTCAKFDRVVWVTEEDRAALDQVAAAARRALPRPGRAVIPICVDPEEQPVMAHRADARRVTFVGGLHWPPNADGILWFTREVWPRVLAEQSASTLTVIGRTPPAELRAPGRHHQVEVPGYVGDPSDYLAETAVFIVPLHAGGGMRVKILEAWCRGLPVVTTSVGAEGLPARDGDNALVADAPEAFARAVLRVLGDARLARRLARGGRRVVEAHYDWRKTYAAWDQIYRDLDQDAITTQPTRRVVRQGAVV